MVLARSKSPEKHNEIAQGTCKTCGGQLALLPEVDMGGLEARCLMCGRSASETPRRAPSPIWDDDFPGLFDEERVDEPEVSISTRAASHLRKLLRQRNAGPGEAFRLMKNGSAAHVEMSKGKPGDLILRSRRRVVLYVAEAAASDLDGAHISLVEKNGEKNITLVMPGGSPRSRSQSGRRRPV